MVTLLTPSNKYNILKYLSSLSILKRIPNNNNNSWRNFFTLPVPKSLDEVVKLQLFRKASPKEQSRLWFERFALRNDVATSIMNEDTYVQFKQNVLHSPQFIIPLQKQNNIRKCSIQQSNCTSDCHYLNLFIQFQTISPCLITTVEATQKERAALYPPLAILSIYSDIVSESGNVFLRCDAIDKKVLNKEDLRYCINYLCAFYTDSNLYSNYVQCFNHTSYNFDFHMFMTSTRSLRQQLQIAVTTAI